MERRRSGTGAMIDSDDDERQSPTPNASFTLLEARDSHADDVDGVNGAPRSRASSSYTPETHRHPFQFHNQNQQRRAAAASANPISAIPSRQPAPPTPESYYEYSGRVGVPSPRATAGPGQTNNSFLLRQQQQQQRMLHASTMHDLFPVIHRSVFTNPENIMPTRQDAIVIDDVPDALATLNNSSTLNGMTGLGTIGPSGATLNAASLAANNQLSLNSLFGTRTGGGAASVGRGAATASARDPSCQSFADLGLRISNTSGDSLSETLQSNGSTARRVSPTKWLRTLVQRFHTNWDSYFLLFTLVLSLAAVPVAIVLAVVFVPHVGPTYRAQCQLPLATGETQFRVSTASLASFLIPALNHVVLFVVASIIAVRCSRARKRVLRSHGQQSVRMNLTSAFMLPCYEAIWYMIAILSLTGIVVYAVSYQPVDNPPADTTTAAIAPVTNSNSHVSDAKYPCSATSLPLVWILQLLPMLMTQRSVSQEAVVRSIVYSGAACIVMLVLVMSLFRQGSATVTAVTIGVYALLLLFYVWAKFVFHARATFDFFFVSAVVGVVASLVVQIMDVSGLGGTHTVFVGVCVVNSLFALTTVALLLSLRADTRYWLGMDDARAPTRNPMRQYMRQLAERGMITNFSTRTSVYDVHRMIEEHRKNVVDFSALKLDGIIAQGATSIVMRGVLRGSTDIALKIYTSVQVTDEELHRFSRETALNVQLSHPNVVRFFGLCVVPPSISLVFEFCEYGGLDVALQSSSLWGLSTKLKAWLDACKAVAYLHSFTPPLLHRDIKTDNFLLGQDYLLKLADFGEANLLRPRTDGTMTIAGTVDYMAPEMILGGKTARYGTAVDTYSLMITLWQIMVPDRSPWHGKTHLEVYTCVKDGERPPLLPSIPQGCAAILESGWAANPVDRVAVADLIPKVHKLWLLSLHQKMLKRTK